MAREFSTNGSFKKNSNGGSKRTSTNTRFFSLYNNIENEAFNSVLNIGAWGNFLTIGIAPKADKNTDESENTGKVYDYSREVSFIFNNPQIILLNEAVNMIWDAYSGKEEVPSVTIQGNKQKIEIGYSSEKRGSKHFENIDNRFYIAIYISSDENEDKVGRWIIYIFEGIKSKSRDNTLMINFNPDDGSCESYKKIYSQFIAFKNCVNSIAENGLFMTNHATYDRLSRDLSSIKSNDGYSSDSKNSESKFMSSFGKNTKRTKSVESISEDDDEETSTKTSASKKRSKPASKKKSSDLDEIDELAREDDEE